MSEIPRTSNYDQQGQPSSTSGNYSHGSPDVLGTEAAFTAARPVVEVAAELHEARMRGEAPGTSVDDLGTIGLPVTMLEKWGFNRALDAANGAEVPPLTKTEETLLDTFKAEAEMVEAGHKLGDDLVVTDVIEDAMLEARDRALNAKTAEEKKKWEDIARHAWEYQDRAEGMRTGGEAEYESFHELFNPNTVGSAGAALEGLEAGIVKPGDTRTHKHIADAKVDAANMRKTAGLYNLIAEMNSTDPTEIEAQRKLELTGQIQEARAKVDPEMLDVIGGTNDVSKRIYENIARLRRELASAPDSETAAKLKDEQAAWQRSLKGMNQYNVALAESDNYHDVSGLSVDELEARQAFMAIWVETNPKEEES